MAKGQQRSNREPKKPKQNKPKKTATPVSQTEELFHGKPKKKGAKT
ncbi:hypothetical protein [Hyphococcus sp.]